MEPDCTPVPREEIDAAIRRTNKPPFDPRYADWSLAHAEETSAERVQNLAKQVKSGQDDPGGERSMS